MKIKRIAKLTTPEAFRQYLDQLQIQLPFDRDVQTNQASPLNQPLFLNDGTKIGNRFCIHPMEGWDGTSDGRPSLHTKRRWQNFGISGAKLIWGCEAVAVRHDGRANPNQLMINESTLPDLIDLRQLLQKSHVDSHGTVDDLLIGLQLTHSGRFSRPNQKTLLEPKILYHHPYLDRKFGIAPDAPVLTDSEIEELIGNYIHAAELAAQAGFHFVDLKHCHGYLGHEFLTARSRSGKYGGSIANRSRFLREMVTGIKDRVPNMKIGVRLSLFDLIAFEPDPDTHIGVPAHHPGYPRPFGAAEDDFLKVDLNEPIEFIQVIQDLGIELLNLTAGSPYYNPHIQRPAQFPPSDGYLPPEDPLVGVARQINACAIIKKEFPSLKIVGTGYTYLQEWLAHVAQAAVRDQMTDFVGIGRMVLSYPEYPSDILTGRSLDPKKLCRTFSDCTTAPRCGLVSGCYPLDHYYKELPDFDLLRARKQQNKL